MPKSKVEDRPHAYSPDLHRSTKIRDFAQETVSLGSALAGLSPLVWGNRRGMYNAWV